ncbi:MAG: hypothetical protein E7616_01605 [Ruminococcaceae bacterium]|nr:hypothetical protein [Oscillospiraceae bacterium]
MELYAKFPTLTFCFYYDKIEPSKKRSVSCPVKMAGIVFFEAVSGGCRSEPERDVIPKEATVCGTISLLCSAGWIG